MTDLDERIRAVVIELIESAPPAPPLLDPATMPRPRRRPWRALAAAAIMVALLGGTLVVAKHRTSSPLVATTPTPRTEFAFPAPFGPRIGPFTVVAAGVVGPQPWRLVLFDSHLGKCTFLQDPRHPSTLAMGSGGCGTSNGPLCANSFGFGVAHIGDYDFLWGSAGPEIVTIQATTTRGAVNTGTVAGPDHHVRYFVLSLPGPDHAGSDYLARVGASVSAIVGRDAGGTTQQASTLRPPSPNAPAQCHLNP